MLFNDVDEGVEVHGAVAVLKKMGNGWNDWDECFINHHADVDIKDRFE